MFELSRTAPAPTLEPSGSTGWRGCARRRGQRGPLRGRRSRRISAIAAPTETTIAETMLVLGEIKHAAKHLKKWMAPQRVSTALQFLPGQKPPDPAAARRRRHHRAVELSAAADAGAGGRRARRGQPRDDQAERTGAAVFRAAEGSDRAEIRRRRDGRHRHRGRHRQSLRIAAVRSSDLHRLDPRRPPGRGGRRAQSDAGHARTRRQIARHRRPLRRSRRGRRAHRLRQTAQCRPDLHRAGLCAGAGRLGAGFRRQAAGPDAAHVRHRSRQQGLHLDRLRPALCAARRPGGGRRRQGRKDPAGRRSPTIPPGNRSANFRRPSSSARRRT